MKLIYLFRKNFGRAVMFSLALASLHAKAQDTNKLVVMDVVNNNPGQPIPYSKFSNPATLKSYGYGAKVTVGDDAPQFGINWSAFDPAVLPVGNVARTWIDNRTAQLTTEYNGIKAGGVKLYCQMDMLIFPTALVTRYKTQMCNAAGKLDISKPFTQQCVHEMMKEIFTTFPQIDGLVVRTGENYLYGEPYHTGNSLVVNYLVNDHIALLKILRDEVCVQRSKDLFYRTWDFGYLHSLPTYYLAVTDSIPVHPHLYFSIKHTIVDFWRDGAPNPHFNVGSLPQYWDPPASEHGVFFNPCLGIGNHKQIVEVQCQREYEGKGTHPDYIAKGVIDGFQELNKPGMPELNSLNKFKNDPHFAGVWTWSHGGGWNGPYTKDELWCELNAYVIAQWAQDPSVSETDIFTKFAKMKGLPDAQVPLFHTLALSSDTGVLKGQYSAMGNMNVLWTRDDNFNGLPNVKRFIDTMIKRTNYAAYIQEKDESLASWKRIEAISKQLTFRDDSTTSFVKVSCTYGRMKYEMFRDAWNIMIRGYVGDKTGTVDQVKLQGAITDYDKTWIDWQAFVKANKNSPTIYTVTQFTPTLEQYRNKSYTDKIIAYSGGSSGKNLNLYWTTSNPTNDHFTVETSTDNAHWAVATTVTQADTTTQSNMYKATFPTPPKGVTWFRINMWDVALHQYTTPSLSYNFQPDATPTSFAASAAGTTVSLDWTTSGELFNDNFKIVRSTDAVNWAFLTLVDGIGTTGPQAYHTTDNSPINGINYYALLYSKQGIVTPYAMKMVDMTTVTGSVVALVVFPNPATANISFSLKGYAGKNVTATVTKFSGKTVGTESFAVNQAGYYTLKAKPESGLYLVTIKGDDGMVKTSRVLVQ